MAKGIQIGIGTTNKKNTKGFVGTGVANKKLKRVIVGTASGNKLAWVGVEPYVYMGHSSPTLKRIKPSGTEDWSYNATALGDINRITKLRINSKGDVFAGCVSNSNTDQRLLVKLNAAGALVWQKAAPGFVDNLGLSPILTNDINDNVYVWEEAGGVKYWPFIKLNSSGTEIWRKSFKDDFGFEQPPFAADCDSMGNIYVGSYSYTTSLYIVKKISPAGVVVWTYTWPLSDKTRVELNLAVDKDGNVYVVYQMSAASTADFRLIKLSTDGVKLGNDISVYNSNYAGYGGICLDKGFVYMSTRLSNTEYAVFRASLSLTGLVTLFTFPNTTNIKALAVDADGCLYTGKGATSVIVKSDQAGNVIWTFSTGYVQICEVLPGKIGTFPNEW